MYKRRPSIKGPRLRPFAPAERVSMYSSPCRREEQTTYPYGPRTTQLPLQSSLELSRVRGLVRVVHVHDARDTQEDGDESADHDEARARGRPGVLPRGEDSEDVVVFVNRFTKVASLLRVPPGGIGVAELALDARGVDVAAVLYSRCQYPSILHPTPTMQLPLTMPGSSASLSTGRSGYFSSRVFLSV